MLILLASLTGATLVLGALSFRTAHLMTWSGVDVTGLQVRNRHVAAGFYNGRLLASAGGGVATCSTEEGVTTLVRLFRPGFRWETGAPAKVINLQWESSGHRRLGFIMQINRRADRDLYRVAMPFWVPAAVLVGLAFLPAAIRADRRRRRRRAGRCAECGYDLRGGTAGVDQCPECGTPMVR